jgi:peptide/nickel transport system substrate-binding protein
LLGKPSPTNAGLVHWKDGQVAPALASSWSERDGPNNTYIITFELRQDVVFHDGSPWDASVAVANFDNVLAEPLVSPDYHAW